MRATLLIPCGLGALEHADLTVQGSLSRASTSASVFVVIANDERLGPEGTSVPYRRIVSAFSQEL